jgi:hypothetical protein
LDFGIGGAPGAGGSTYMGVGGDVIGAGGAMGVGGVVGADAATGGGGGI